ncbi:methyltransferase TYW3-domain-containing protein [Aspergillus pseudonomiae]|uniref:tRNA(Phe) 7-[(3-amino-3-carboxypropyl)-4-demethylwyosine(37)-N(4)]-methyltransferase n=1 Tax=Aspergillus pseudonomiae TaxID=1506151 RepID=A0A5N7CWI0_9EURO|nr:methyltransferase TYW3-domain-containing protein [Aspergillus pseudonomiae]KAB8255149.1 methyltransferase TYW3-domain-containing protein [Aspergillus pseudonomiae]KAE8398546.1 methyltransferase TYW3-domain-containing protein [Aspergillus pseudonomiae]
MIEVEASAIPEVFESRKRKILAELSVPDAEYTDLSPKGSVDEGIRDLIDDINAHPGLVTTSSCAGRISVFLEGRRKQAKPQEEEQGRQFVASGGKGAGKWLYVSHDPLQGYGALCGSKSPERSGPQAKSLHALFGMVPGDGKPPGLNKQGKAPRLVRFHFEPLILHIMTATLQHAHPVLSAASSSGFRESGLQSLRCLEGEEGPSPIVAVRSAGLSLESVIGYCEDSDADDATATDEPVIRSLVTEEYLQMLVAISNERFAINTERKTRFRESLLDLYSANRGPKTNKKTKPPGWEDAQTRRERMRAEGLMRKKLLQDQAKDNEVPDTLETTKEP